MRKLNAKITVTLLAALLCCFCINVNAQSITVQSNNNASQLASNLLGSGVTVSNATLDCGAGGAGTFNANGSGFSLGSGVLLTSGTVQNALGPNNNPGTTGSTGNGSDPDLNALIPQNTQDKCVLEFDIVPFCSTITVNYVFASEEYLEFGCTSFNDVFAFFISGPGYTGKTNIALVPGTTTPVSINNVINDGASCVSFPAFYVNNPPGIEYDGATITLTATANVTPCLTYSLKLAIADAGDQALDSGVFLEAGGTGCTTQNLNIAGNVSNESCPNANDGSINISVSGGTGPFAYSWTGPGGFSSTSQNISNLADGTYTVTVNGSSCVSSGAKTFTVGTNSSSCNQPPNAVCNNQVLSAGGNCNANVSAAVIGAGSNDPNGNPLTYSVSPAGPYGLGTTQVTLTVSDGTSSDQCTATVTVVDNTNPVANCPGNITVNNAPGQCSAAVTWNATASDNCPNPSISCSPSSGSSFNVGSSQVTCTAIDGAGNQGQCSFTVTVLDNENPTISCPSNISVGTDAGQCGAVVSYNVPVSDNCPNVVLSHSGGLMSGSLFPVGTTTNTYVATDAANNSVSCSFTVTVADDEAPAIACPSNISVGTDAGVCSAGVSYSANASDNCGNPSVTYNPASGSTFAVGTGSVTATATDGAGNSSNCTFSVTVSDNEAPNAVCKNTTVQLNAGGNASITSGDVNNGSSDNCGITAISVSPSSFNCSNTSAPVSVTLSVEDANGNTDNCTASVTVLDNIAPNAVCQDVTVALDAAGNGSTTATAVDDGSSDNCGIASRSLDISSFGCGDVGTVQVELTVTDVNGNISMCMSDVIVEDNVAPNAVCQDVTIQLDASGNGFTTAGAVNNGSNDACGIASTSLDNSAFACTNVGSNNTVTLTVTDNNGNTSTCTATVTVEDNVDPVAICQDVTVQLDASGNGSTSASAVDNGSNDACGIASTSLDNSAFACTNVGSNNTVTLTVEDNNGNTATCTATVTVEDNVNPVALCQDVTVQLDASGNGSTSASAVDNGSNDACGIASTSLDNTDFNCSNVSASPTAGSLIISEYVEGSGFTKYVEIFNGTGAAVNLANYSIRLYSNGATSPSTTSGLGAAGTLADGQTAVFRNNSATAYTGTSFSIGAVNWNGDDAFDLYDNVNNTQVDIFGEIGVDPGSQWNVSGNNTANQTLRRNSSVLSGNTSNAAGFPSLGTEWTEFASNDVSGLGTHSLSGGGSNSVVLTVTDNNGNSSSCTANVTVEDNVAPNAVCADVTVQLDDNGSASVSGAQVGGGSTDACGIASLDVSPNTFGCSNAGSNSVTLTATDANGNSSTCTANVTVEDNVAPLAACQNVTVQLDAAGAGSITTGDVDNGSSDNCAITNYSLDNSNFGCADVGGPVQASGLIISEYVEGSSNNKYIEIYNGTGAAVNLADYQIRVYFNGNSNANSTSSLAAAGTLADGGVAVFRNSNANIYAGPSFVINSANWNGDDAIELYNTQTSQAEDIFGDIGTDPGSQWNVGGNSTQNNTVRRNGSVSAGVTGSNAGFATLGTEWTEFAQDDVSGLGYHNYNPAGSQNQVTLTVSDASGNSSSCTAQITVEDNVNPNALCQDVTVQLDASGNGSTSTTAVDNGSNDACGILSLSLDNTDFNCSNVGSGNTVTLTVTDNNGNTATCASTVTVEDNIAPVALCQDVTVQLDASGNGSTSAGAVDNGSNDACGIASLALDNSDFDCSNVGSGNTVTLTVTDNNGNTATCASTVTVEDNVNPVALCQDVTVQLDASGNGSTSATAVDNGSNDACGIASLVLSKTGFDCSNLGSNPVVLTVTDNNGNVSTCNANVEVEDNIAPSITCPADFTFECLSEIPAPNTGLVSASDNCTVVAINHVGDVDNGASGCAGEPFVITRTYEAVDQSGNTTSCDQLITVESTPIVCSISASPNTFVFPAFPDSSCTTITSTVSGGCPPYTISWSNGDQTASTTVCPTASTTYIATWTDAEGCTGSCSIDICVIDITCVDGDNNGVKGNGQGGQGQNNSPNAQVHVKMCHVPPGNPSNAMTKCLPIPAVEAHMAQQHGGDHLGACGSIVDRACDLSSPKMADVEDDIQPSEPMAVESKFEAFPNPFTSATTIRFTLGEDAMVSLNVFSVDGKLAASLLNEEVAAGVTKSVTFSPENASEGIYFAKMVTSTGIVKTHKLILVK